MIIKPARINQQGIDAVIRYGNNPELLRLDNDWAYDQTYIPGISVEGIPLLEQPFNVPIVGDNESVSLSIDWPRTGEVSALKRISFVGMLPAESITLGDPEYEAQDVLEAMMDDEEFQPHNDAFDEYIGDIGGFLRAVVDIRPSFAVGLAEFYCMENMDEFEQVQELLETGEVSAAEIVNIVRFAKYSNQRDLRTLSCKIPTPDFIELH